MKKNFLDWLAMILLIIGGLNWGLLVFNFNLVTAITMNIAWLTKTIYGLVGLSALYGIYLLFALKK